MTPDDPFFKLDGRDPDHRWDRDRNAKLLNIVFVGGTFGNFLKYFLERFSIKTPRMDKDPFTDTGTAHQLHKADFSGLIQRYHVSFINDNQGQKDLPICIITPSTRKHFLYFKKARLFRNGDTKVRIDDQWKKNVKDMDPRFREQAKNIALLYDLKGIIDSSMIPRFIVRDWYKQDFFRNIEETDEYQYFEVFKTHDFFKRQDVYQLDLEAFFDWNFFLDNMKQMDERFNLQLDFSRESDMKQIFDKGYDLDKIRQECDLAEKILSDTVHDIDLDVDTEGFIYAELEKQNPDIQMPLSNHFFQHTKEIHEYLDNFPNWYRRSNPNIG